MPSWLLSSPIEVYGHEVEAEFQRRVWCQRSKRRHTHVAVSVGGALVVVLKAVEVDGVSDLVVDGSVGAVRVARAAEPGGNRR